MVEPAHRGLLMDLALVMQGFDSQNKTHSCILVSRSRKTNDSYILRGMYSLSKHAADFYVLECIPGQWNTPIYL